MSNEHTGEIVESYKSILKKLRVSTDVSKECLAQTAELIAQTMDSGDLEDLRDQPFVTIDNDDSRDLDQALLIEATDGGFVVWYALADAAFFIRPGTPLYEHALRQGTSHYFPSWSVPMLPAELSEDVISLNPHVDRRAVVFRVALGADGVVTHVALKRAMIHSQAKLAYDGVQAWLDGKHNDYDGSPFAESLRLLQTVGLLRMDLAKEREAIMFERYEPEVRVNDRGDRFEVSRRIRNDVERYNEQISLLCNTEGARLMAELGHSPHLQSVFRVHLPPLSQRLGELHEILDDIVKTHALGPEWQWNGQSLADYLADLPAGEEHARLRIAIERQVRYANRSSDFSATVGPHFALGVDHYARFTAPMREIVGIFTHKEALEVLGMQPASRPEDDELLRDRVIEAANRGNSTQRAIEKEVGLMVIRQVFEDDLAAEPHLRPVRSGTIVGVRPTRLYVLLDDIPVDVKVWSEDLAAVTGGPLDFSAGVLGSEPPFIFKVGDEIRLRTSHFDAGRRHIVLAPVFD